jgi:hypothetical protein
MATETFPSSLPDPSASYGFDVSSDKIRTREKTALYKNRQRSEVRIYKTSVDWQFTDSQMETFRDWFRDDISEGSEIFNIDLFFGGGIKTNEAKFAGGSYSYSFSENLNWSVSAELEVWNADVADEETAYYAAMMAAMVAANPLVSPNSPDIDSWILNFNYTNALELPFQYATIETFGPVTRAALQLPLNRAVLETLKPLTLSAETLNLSTATLETGSS